MDYFVSAWRRDEAEEKLLPGSGEIVSLLGGTVKFSLREEGLAVEADGKVLKLPVTEEGLWPPVAAARYLAVGLRPAAYTSGRTLDLSGRTELAMGREPGSDILLEDQLVSRQHLHLQNRGGSWEMEVLGSNGAWVSGKKVPAGGRAVLRDGDEVMIPSFSFTFRDGGLEIPAGMYARYRRTRA